MEGLSDDDSSWEKESDLKAFAEEIKVYLAQKSSRTMTLRVKESVTGRPAMPHDTLPMCLRALVNYCAQCPCMPRY